jgi:hypothetical protein
MKASILIIIGLFLSMHLRAQNPEPTPFITFKVGLHVMGSYGTDWRSYTEDNAIFFQPGLHGGLLFKDLFYVGMLGSKYCCFNYNDAYGFEQNILAAEVGVPIKKVLVGITIGYEDYDAPQRGGETAQYQFKSILIGLFADYRLMKNLSIPIRIAYSKDPQKYGYGPYWHFSFGFSGNILVKRNPFN